MDFRLETDRETLEAATVFSKSKREELKLPQLGLERVDAAIVKKLPALMGESDIIRVIQMMPGVQTPSEGATGFSVRGGGIDQNLILIDGAPVYNCGHFLGFLSMFNSDAIRSAELYKGDFPASYGGRIASVLDIDTKDGNQHRFGGSASIGLITSKVFVEGPVVPEKLSFMATARRTYLDLFFPLLGNNLPDKTQMFFYDLNAKLSWIAGEKDRVYLSAFSGRDVFGLSMEEFDMGRMKFGFRNNTQSLRWNHVYGPALPALIVQGYTRENTGSIIVDQVANDVHYVYAADGAECYHEYKCKFAFASSQRLTVYEAYYLGFRPCGRCKPPIYDPVTNTITEQQQDE